jgi:two-component system response regulator
MIGLSRHLRQFDAHKEFACADRLPMASKFLPFVYVDHLPQHSEAFKAAFRKTRVPNEITILREITEARNYFSRVAERRQDPPALALVNLAFKNNSGLELIRWIRSFEKLSTIPIVALASNYDFDDLERSYNNGANLYLLRPNNVREWADLVFRLQGYWSGQSDVPLPQLL